MPEFDSSLASIHRELLKAQSGDGADLLRQIFITHSMLFYHIPEGALSYAEMAADHLLSAFGSYKKGEIEDFRESLLAYYTTIQVHSELYFDPIKAAKLDAECWRLSEEYKGQPERVKLAETYASLYGCLFGIAPERLFEAGVYMALANYECNLATDPETPAFLVGSHWTNVEGHLGEFYNSLGESINAESLTPS
jgi:hypothetical protein